MLQQVWVFCELETYLISFDGKRVTVSFPAGTGGRGWMAVVGTFARFVWAGISIKQPQMPVEGARVARAPARKSYLEVARGKEGVVYEGGKPEKKNLVKVAFTFDEREYGWMKISNKLEVARNNWLVIYANLVGR